MRNLSKKNNDFELLDFNKILSLDILVFDSIKTKEIIDIII